MSKNHRRTGKFAKPAREPFLAAKARSKNQQAYLNAIFNNDIIFCTGHPGSGKSLLALSAALSLFYDREQLYERIIIVRPYIKTKFAEDLGALPGTLDEKVHPFVEAILDNLRVLCDKIEAENLIRHRNIEFSILSMLRGRSLNNCIIIVEEAQNVPNLEAFKMILTRLGEQSKLIIAGDINQSDIEGSVLQKTIELVSDLDGIVAVQMSEFDDIQRNPLIKEILRRFDNGSQNS